MGDVMSEETTESAPVAEAEAPEAKKPEESKKTETEARAALSEHLDRLRRERAEFCQKATGGDVTYDRLMKIKEEYTSVGIWIWHNDKVFVYRPIRRMELQSIQEKYQNELEADLAVVQQCVLWPRLEKADWNSNQPGLLVANLSSKIMLLSGAPSQELDEAPLIF
jgi:hypothetical protein